MANEIRTLSQDDPVYAALEFEIAEVLEHSKRTKEEGEFAQRLRDKENIEGALASVLLSAKSEDLAKLADALWPKDLVLPTIYDDPVSYTITAALIHQVQSAATEFGFDQSNYGGFCCAPTGYVGAMAIPVAIPKSNEFKVFVVYESGLLTFIDGVVRCTVTATPDDLLIDEAPEDWNMAWDRYKTDINNLQKFRDAGIDLRAWVGFLTDYKGRKDLAYVGLAAMTPTHVNIVACMVESAQLFVTAHEYVHAIEGHDDPNIADDFAEREADRIGAHIAISALSQRRQMNMFHSLAGIALAIEAICINHTPDDPHLPPADRVELVVSAVQFENDGDEELARAIVKLYTRIFTDLLNFAP